jgi:hypothetical protein
MAWRPRTHRWASGSDPADRRIAAHRAGRRAPRAGTVKWWRPRGLEPVYAVLQSEPYRARASAEVSFTLNLIDPREPMTGGIRPCCYLRCYPRRRSPLGRSKAAYWHVGRLRPSLFRSVTQTGDMGPVSLLGLTWVLWCASANAAQVDKLIVLR